MNRIDWQQPWLAPLQPCAASLIAAADWRQALNAEAARMDLRNHRNLPIRFVAQADLPPDAGYEAFISATGNVPTRDNLHDFFNALVWLVFPQVKRQLNALQAAEIIRRQTASNQDPSGGNSRGRLRDAATIFDENAALLVTGDMELVAALRNHQWREAFVTRRAAFGRDCNVCLFGHALMEKLTSPYKAITAHAWLVVTGDTFFLMPQQDQIAWLDTTVAMQLAHGLVTSDFTPLPVLGVPGWWPQQDDRFYDDATVFRPKRRVPR